MEKRLTIGVLFGGRSSEFEISLRSAVSVLKHLPAEHKLILVGLNHKDGWFQLSKTYSSQQLQAITPAHLQDICEGRVPADFTDEKILTTLILPHTQHFLSHSTLNTSWTNASLLNLQADVVFPVLHGTNGEDGRLQGLFELADMAFVGCDQRSSVVGIDKDLQKRLALQAQVPTVPYHAITHDVWQHQDRAQAFLHHCQHTLGFPCFVKPNALGSAVGVHRSQNPDQLRKHIEYAFAYDEKVLVEKSVTGTEIECAFLGSQDHFHITDPGEIAPKDFYSYQEKYETDSEAAIFVPSRLDPTAIQKVKDYATTLVTAFGLEGLCRLDFWNCQPSKEIIFNEINTLPGLTPISLYPKLLEREHIPYEQWLKRVLDQALRRQTKALQKKYIVLPS